MAEVHPDPNLPCGYCCAPRPCGDQSDDHDDMFCRACEAVPMSPVAHPECLRMVDAYMADLAAERAAGGFV